MIKNLDTADTIVKLAFALLVIVLYFSHVISGPGSKVLMVFAIALIAIDVFKRILFLFTRD